MRPHRPFEPAGSLRNAHVQSLLASSGLRRMLIRRRRSPALEQAETVLLDCGDGIRLEGRYAAAAGEPRGLVVLLHGWEGSVDSTYILDAASCLHGAGFAVFRLNFRDHGDTHHLNPGMFHSCRLDEVVNAVKAVADLYEPRPLMLAGFSLGGNFALRVARAAPGAGLELAHAFAVSPVISPPAGLAAIQQAPWIYEAYFMRKWRRSLRRKQALFPDRYTVDEWLRRDLMETTRGMVERYTEFASAEHYLDGYAIGGDRLAELTVPASVVTAADDPVIPAADFEELAAIRNIDLLVTDHGGHCGFIENWRLDSWISELLVHRFLAVAGCDAQTQDQRRRQETLSC